MYYIRSYTEAKSLQEISNLLLNENSMIIAGGTDVLIKARELKEGYIDKDLIGITRISELGKICLDENGDILIGSTCTFSQIENSEIINKFIPILAGAAGMLGGPQIRNVATIGGNICNGATSADSASTLFCLDAIMIIKSLNSQREISIRDFYIKSGVVALNRGEFLYKIKIKKENFLNYCGEYIKFAPRRAMDIATIGCAVLLKQENNILRDIKISFGVAGPIPLRALNAEKFAKGKELSDENINEIANLSLQETNPRDSWRASKEFRQNLIFQLTRRAIYMILRRYYA